MRARKVGYKLNRTISHSLPGVEATRFREPDASDITAGQMLDAFKQAFDMRPAPMGARHGPGVVGHLSRPTLRTFCVAAISRYRSR